MGELLLNNELNTTQEKLSKGILGVAAEIIFRIHQSLMACGEGCSLVEEWQTVWNREGSEKWSYFAKTISTK